MKKNKWPDLNIRKWKLRWSKASEFAVSCAGKKNKTVPHAVFAFLLCGFTYNSLQLQLGQWNKMKLLGKFPNLFQELLSLQCYYWNTMFYFEQRCNSIGSSWMLCKFTAANSQGTAKYEWFIIYMWKVVLIWIYLSSIESKYIC